MSENRRAKMYVSMERIAEMMQVPDGVRPLFMYAISDPPGAYMIVECEKFPPQPHGCELPLIGGVQTTVLSAEIDGKTFRAFEQTTTADDMAEALRPGSFWTGEASGS